MPIRLGIRIPFGPFPELAVGIPSGDLEEFVSHPSQAVARILRLLPLVGALAGNGCAGSEVRSVREPGEVLVMAAASTQDAVQELADILRERHGIVMTISTAGSNALAQQILAGAPGDIFLSADPRWVEEIAKAGHVAETVPLLGNDLVLVVPEANRSGVRGPRDLLSDRVRHVALAGEDVPAGRYAERALGSLGLLETLSASGRLVRGQNVRITLAYIERGEVDAGIVYATDAAVASAVRIVHTFDRGDYPAVIYPLVLTTRGNSNPAAVAVFAFLQSAEARTIFVRYGFRSLATGGSVSDQ